MKEEKTHRLVIEGRTGTLVRDLPIREVAPGVRVALFNLLGDAELTEVAGRKLAGLIPEDVEALIMPEGKALALLHVVQRATGYPAVVARKERKSYMREPVIGSQATSMTTRHRHDFFIDAADAEILRGKKAAFLDDVVSSGGTEAAITRILDQVEARIAAVMCVCTEGAGPHDGVIALAHLPLY